MKTILKKLNQKKIKIGIVGLGYVGLDLVRLFAGDKYFVYGFDNDIKKVNILKKNRSHINYIPNLDIKNISKFTEYNNKFSNIKKCDVILLCLPTPLTKFKTPDLSYVSKAISLIEQYIKKDQIIILESTTYPGTTEEYLVKKFKSKFIIGKNLFIGYSPERIDPGNKFKYKMIPKIVSGYTQNCLKITEKFYSNFFQTVPVKNLETAEITKLYENIYRSVNIGLVNEMKTIADKLKINIFDVIEAAKTKPYGFNAFYPGPGLGGHCVPIDPYYLSWKVKSINMNTRFIELAAEINGKMPSWVVEKIKEIFIQNKITTHKSKILLIGVSYKKNINDMRESPAIEIFNLLNDTNVKIDILDPFCESSKVKNLFKNSRVYKDLNDIKIDFYNAALIVTDHDTINYDKLIKYSKIIIDTRGRLKNKKSKKIYII
ncbi:nucleotide sugar dehydrogenase [Pelagibacterales bacterium SAG-MED02]|nr:nucleotide sugar dehydrogenase [Pelagibacterales bacterium SAG-MED02]